MLSQLSSSCCSVPFHRHCLISFSEFKSKCNTQSNPLVVADNVECIIGIERNRNGQIYSIPNLHVSAHGTIASHSFKKLVSLPYRCHRHGDDSISSSANIPGKSSPVNSVSDTRMMKYLFVPSSSNYCSPGEKIAVINDEDQWCSKYGPVHFNEVTPSKSSVPASNGGHVTKVKVCNPIEYTTKEIISMFECGLSECFMHDSKKRSGNVGMSGLLSKPALSCQSGGSVFSKSQRRRQRKKSVRDKKNHRSSIASSHGTDLKSFLSKMKCSLPTITLGWSQADSNQYKQTKATIAGNIKPFLRDGRLPSPILKHLLNAVRCAVFALPVQCVFQLETAEVNTINSIRKGMVDQLEKMLGGEEADSNLNINVEGITILIPCGIGFHKDTNNCSRPGMESVIQINCNIPMNEKTIVNGNESDLWDWLIGNGFRTHFPCSLILYSRKCVGAICQRVQDMEVFSNGDKLTCLLKWALMDRVGSIVDYESTVWNNDDFPNDFAKLSVCERNVSGRSFRGTMMKTVACYNKIVSPIFVTCF